LEPVASIPSGASVGEIYTINKSETVAYGWEEIENGYAFNCSLNPASGDTPVLIGDLVGAYTGSSVYMYSDGHIEAFGDSINIGFVRQNEWQLHPDPTGQSYVTTNYYNYNRIEFTFTDARPGLENAISSRSVTSSEIKAVQVAGVNLPIAHWELLDKYQDRYGQIQCWINENGKKDLTPNTELGLFRYYEAYFKLYTNNDGYFCVDYSSDSAVTWNHYISNANIPVSEPEYYPIDVTDPNGKNVLLKAWFKAGDGNYGLIIKANKSLWIENIVTPTGIVPTNILMEGASYEILTLKPSINGVELSGNKSTNDLKIRLGSLDGDFGIKNLQSFTYSADGSDVSGKTGFVIDWDGSSDMTYTAEAYYSKSWGSNSACTPYFSAGTWHNVAEWRNCGHTFEILPGNKLYYKCVSDASNWKFDGNYSGSTELNYIDSIQGAALGTLQLAQTSKEVNSMIVFENANTSGTATFSASTGDVVVLDIDLVFDEYYFITGGTINGVALVQDGDFLSGELSDGLSVVKTYQNYAAIYDLGHTINPWDSPYQSKTVSITNVERTAGDGQDYFTDYIFNPKDTDSYDAFQYNGYTWDKLAKDYELPAPAVGETWVPFVASGFTYVRQDFNGAGQYGVECGGDAKSYVLLTADGNLDFVSWGSKINLGNGIWVNTPLNGDLGYVYWWVKDGKVYTKVSGNKIIAAFKDDNIGTNPEGCLPF